MGLVFHHISLLNHLHSDVIVVDDGIYPSLQLSRAPLQRHIHRQLDLQHSRIRYDLETHLFTVVCAQAHKTAESIMFKKIKNIGRSHVSSPSSPEEQQRRAQSFTSGSIDLAIREQQQHQNHRKGNKSAATTTSTRKSKIISRLSFSLSTTTGSTSLDNHVRKSKSSAKSSNDRPAAAAVAASSAAAQQQQRRRPKKNIPKISASEREKKIALHAKAKREAEKRRRKGEFFFA